MIKASLVLFGLCLLAACGETEETGGLTADERQRLENIAKRLDEENAEVRELLEDNSLMGGELDSGENKVQ
jgi:hypothetical protein